MDILEQIFWTMVFILIFWVCVNVVVKLFKLQGRGVEAGPIHLIAKTKKLNQAIDRIARKFPRFWRVFFYIGIVIGYISVGFIMYFLAFNLYELITNPKPTNAVVPLIPGITVTGMPLVYVLIAIGVIAVSHEIAHGIAARLESVKLKSVGLMVLIVLFAAFVEIDEYSMSKRKKFGRLSVYAAGSFANFVVGLFAFIFMTSMYASNPAGVLVQSTVYGGPSYGLLQPKDVIIKVNGTSITNGEDFDLEISKIKPLQVANFSLYNLNTGIYRTELVRTGFNPSYESTSASRCRYTPEKSVGVISGENISKLDINYVKEVDNLQMIFNSESKLLNITFLLNISRYRGIMKGEIEKIMVNITGRFNTTVSNALIYLTNFTDLTNKCLLFKSSSIQTLSGKYLNISSDVSNLSHYISKDSMIKCEVLINASSDFQLLLDEFSFYIITNETIGWYGIYTYDYYPPEGLGKYLYGKLTPYENPVFQSLFYIWMLSWGVALMNLLPCPPFDGDRLVLDLIAEPGEIYPVPPKEEEREKEDKKDGTESNHGEKEKIKKQEEKVKIPWTYKKVILWIIRGVAIFLLCSNIGLSIYWMVMTGNYNIFDFLF